LLSGASVPSYAALQSCDVYHCLQCALADVDLGLAALLSRKFSMIRRRQIMLRKTLPAEKSSCSKDSQEIDMLIRPINF
jgi:hypothetical protein